MCVKFSKIDHGVRLSHPLGAAVARLPKAQRGERRRRRGGGVHPLGGPEHRQAAWRIACFLRSFNRSMFR
jgi:hypothetical protein